MGIVAVWVWVGVVVLGLVVLGFCAYELIWKVRRLGRDVEALQRLGGELARLSAAATRAQGTIARVQELRAPIGANRTPLSTTSASGATGASS